jgi:uncharacterized DUF497 family protein
MRSVTCLKARSSQRSVAQAKHADAAFAGMAARLFRMYIHQSYILNSAWSRTKPSSGMLPTWGHILRHGVTPFEVEEVTGRPHVVIEARAVIGENRWKMFGTTESGRYLVVVFTIRRRLFRAVTAYDMNIAERRRYAAQVG